MALEYLDLENKLYIPTQTLITQIHYSLINIYGFIRQYLIDTQDTVSALGQEWYDNPIETTTLWYEQSVNYGTDIYVKVLDQLLPQTKATYNEMLVTANDLGIKTMDSINHIIDNPEQVSAETIESMTETLTMASNISSELVNELQGKSSEIIGLLLEQPMQTLEAAYMEILSSLLNGYFEVVSNILASL